MKLELKRISIWATIKISFVINLVFGFILGCFYALLFAAMSMLPTSAFQNGELDRISGAFGVLALFIPFFVAFTAAILNTILAFILVIVYNFSARLMGGLELEFAKIDDQGPALAPVVTVPAVTPTAPVQPPPTPSPHSPYDRPPTAPPEDYQL